MDFATPHAPSDVVLEARDVAYAYPSADAPSLDGVTLAIRRGDLVLLTGPSGSGKSTLLRAFLGLVPHLHGGELEGEVRAFGADVGATLPHRLAPRVGMVFQNPEDQLVASAVEFDVAFGPENLGLPRAEVASRVERALDRAGIVSLRRRSVYELSSGQQQRVALAGVLALQPEVLLLDEPTSQIDPRSATTIIAQLAKLNREAGLTIVIAEHRLEHVLPLANRLVVMNRGKVVLDSTTRSAVERSSLSEIGVGLPRAVELSREILADGPSLSVDEVVERVTSKLTNGRERPSRGGANGVAKSPVPSRSLGRPRDLAQPLVKVTDLEHGYPNGVVALRGVGLEIAAGEAVALLGQSGAGKSTLARHLNGLLRPSGGKVVVAGLDAASAPVSRLAATVGYVFQNPLHQLFAETVEDELALGPRALGWSPEDVEARVADLLAEFELERYRGRHPLALSEGERRRLALAATIAARPLLVIMDEPTVGQDRGAKTRLGELIGRLTSAGRSALVITHDVEFAADHCSRFVVMAEGRVLADGVAAEVLDRPEVLAAAGLELPQLVEVGQRLAGWGFDRGAWSLDSAQRELSRLMDGG